MYKGLYSEEVNKLIRENGFNEIPEKRTNLLHKILKNFISPIGLMLLLASCLSFALGKSFDGYFILILLLLNSIITLWQESKADNAIKKLNENLQQKIKVYRDKTWQYTSSRFLVPGDIIQLSSGEIIPADGHILEAQHISINESALTGESLPKDKGEKDNVFSGSFIARGIAVIEIDATGVNTKFGKTLFSVERVRKKSLLEKDIISISRFLTILSLLAVVILTVILLFEKVSLLELLTLDLSLVIAGIPISMPTVMTLIIELGVVSLAKKHVIVRRLSSLEDLSNVDFLLTDKTGTLTKNKITVQEIHSYDGYTDKDVLVYATMLATAESDNPIDTAIIEKAKLSQIQIPTFNKIDFIPADSKRKRSTMTLKKDNETITISVGAPQIIADFSSLHDVSKKKYDQEVQELAEKGYRTLAVGISKGSKEASIKVIGLIALSDTLRTDAKTVITFLQENGIGVSMVTGDNKAIAKQIAYQLGMIHREIVVKAELDKIKSDLINTALFQNTSAFAEILPEDKFHLVQYAKKYFTVASNGDGVNDLPAVKAANVGIAVKNAVTALKATADIVLLSEGISVIRDAIIESRKIFERVYTYSLYRISESLRLIITIAILGIFYGTYPMTALQIILLALLNDIPIISLAFDKVSLTGKPGKINSKQRFTLSSLFGLVGVLESLFLFFIAKNIWHLPINVVQTMFFLKLTVSGHMLIYVAHTMKRWWKFLPSKEVIWATTVTQLLATFLAFSGFLMPIQISPLQICFVWVWAFLWMQIGEAMKVIQDRS